jgi:hypothetical protein
LPEKTFGPRARISPSAGRVGPVTLLGYGRRVDAYLDAGNRASDAAELCSAGRVEREERGGLGETVPDGHPPSQTLQSTGEIRVQGSAAGDEHP